MKKVLRLEQWENIIRNLREDDEEVEIVWLDGTDEYCLCYETELFEDGFESEQQAMDRLEEVLTELQK